MKLLFVAIHLLFWIQAPQTAPPLVFEAAIVKGPESDIRPLFHCHGANRPETRPPVGIGRCQGHATLRELISVAFDLPQVGQTIIMPTGMRMNVVAGTDKYWIEGAPSWVDSLRYDVQAEAGTAVTQEELQQMLLSLLKDRFKLALHRESRPLDGYALVIRKGGSKLTPASGNEDDPGIYGHAPGDGSLQISWKGANVPVAELAHRLASITGTPVVDLTGLKGNYNFTLPYFVSPRAVNSGDGPSLFTVIQDLGLQLESRKVPVDVIVIDHVEQPQPN